MLTPTLTSVNILKNIEPRDFAALYLMYDSVFGKRVLTYLENRGNPDYSQINGFMVGKGNYVFLERGKLHLSKNV